MNKILPSSLLPPPSPHIPDQAGFYARTISFKNWPKNAKAKVSDLVKSGFSYLGIGDRVQCFQCGEIFEHWRESDIADDEHASLSTTCSFILGKLGRINQLAYAAKMDYRLVVPEDVPASMRSQTKNRIPIAPGEIRARLDTAWSRKLLDMKYTKPLLAHVIGERLVEIGDDFPSFTDYFQAVRRAELIMSGGHHDTLKDYYERGIERLYNPALIFAEQCGPKAEPVEPATTKTASEYAPTKSESKQACSESLRRNKECNICMDAEADSVFMPCRHMCACKTCADKLYHCPICRKPIKQCIRVYV